MADESKQEDQAVHVASDSAEAVFHAIAALIDDLSFDDQMAVILNLARGAMLKHVESHVAENSQPSRYVNVYVQLCSHMANEVMGLPDRYVDDLLEEMEADQRKQAQAN